MFTEKQIEDLIDLLLQCNSDTKIYIGCDSVRYKKNGKWWARYATVCIVHKNGKNGAAIFSAKQSEPDYDRSDNMKKYRPKMRMMNEVQKTCELYMQLIPFIEGFDIEIHLDISKEEKNASNVAATEAAGYVLGMTNLPANKIKLKPDAFSASFGADAVVNKAEKIGK